MKKLSRETNLPCTSGTQCINIRSIPLFKVTELLGQPEHEPCTHREVRLQGDEVKEGEVVTLKIKINVRRGNLHQQENHALMKTEESNVTTIVLHSWSNASFEKLLDHSH